MANTKKQEACQLYIEQEIETGLAGGKTKYAIGQEIAGWIEKLFGAKVKPDTIRVRATRYEEDLCTNVHSGNMEMTPERTKIIKDYEIKEQKREERKQANELLKKDIPAPKGQYDVIVIDPPWPMKKIVRDIRPNQVAEIDYPIMGLDEIKNIKIPAVDNCHLFLWVTHRFLPDSFSVIESWGFNYICCFVWHKPGGFQPIGLPQYNCEFVLYCRKGTPKFTDLKAFSVCFTADRGAHSEKPEEFYQVVQRVTSGKRLDMFSRRKITGFESWGYES